MLGARPQVVRGPSDAGLAAEEAGRNAADLRWRRPPRWVLADL